MASLTRGKLGNRTEFNSSDVTGMHVDEIIQPKKQPAGGGKGGFPGGEEQRGDDEFVSVSGVEWEASPFRDLNFDLLKKLTCK